MHRAPQLLAFTLTLLSALPIQARESAPTTGAAMSTAAQAFITSLTSEQRTAALLKFDDPRRLDWHNIPKSQRKGVQYRDLSPEQRELALALLCAALSDVGYDKALKIMSLESNLREGEKGLAGAPLRDPERYFITLFGDPAAEGDWGWSWEGHHFSQNFVVHDGQVVGDTPSFWGANPATVKLFVEGGPEVGTRTLAQEEQLAFELLHSLDADQRRKAIVADKAPADYRGPGAPEPPRAAPEGLIAADMTDSQRQTLQSLLETYCGNLAPEVATARLAELHAAGADRIHFAWFGAVEPGVGHAYHIQGPTFLLELVNVQSDPAGNVANHIHSVWRSLEHDFGIDQQAKN